MGYLIVNEKFKKIQEIFELNSFKFFPLKSATPEEFYNAIADAKKTNSFGAYVEQHSIEEYSDMRFLFLTLDGKAGIAITTDNNIVSIFNGGTQKGVLKTLLPVAIQFGGDRLDNYDGKLSTIYE